MSPASTAGVERFNTRPFDKLFQCELDAGALGWGQELGIYKNLSMRANTQSWVLNGSTPNLWLSSLMLISSVSRHGHSQPELGN